MVSIRICNSCGNLYNRTAGMEIVDACPVCHSGNHKNVEIG